MKTTLKNRGIFLIGIIFIWGCNSQNQKAVNQGPKTDTVIIKAMTFNPAELTVQKGDTVVWINQDLVAHDVTSDRDHAFYSDTIYVGKSWKMAIMDSASYHCSIHPTMTGQLLLKP